MKPRTKKLIWVVAFVGGYLNATHDKLPEIIRDAVRAIKRYRSSGPSAKPSSRNWVSQSFARLIYDEKLYPGAVSGHPA